MSDEIEYIVRDESISHASFLGSVVSRYNTRKKREGTTAKKTQSIIGRDWSQNGQRKTNPYGNYKSPYYDPVKRHEYYEAHKDHVTRPYGTGGSSSSGGKSGSGKKGSSKKSGKGSGKGNSNSQSITEAIAKLREESAINTGAQQEATKRKIEDLRAELAEHMEKLKSQGSESEETVNTAEIRGKIQQLQDEIKKAGIDLASWIKTEKESLARRIDAIKPKKKGEKSYDTKQKEYEQALKTKNKEIESRADAIYKRRKKS